MSVKAVIDTNVLVSSFLSKNPNSPTVRIANAQIYERTRRELENEKSPEVWDEKNAALHRLGLRTIPNPNE